MNLLNIYYFLVLISSRVFLRFTRGFNLDYRIPIIKERYSTDEKFFGFSVAQHRTRWNEALLLVGAPQDQNLQPGTRKSGALYKCPLTTTTTDCVQVETDGKRWSNYRNLSSYGVYDGNIDRLQIPLKSEIKDGQWLGVQVQSQGEGGKVIVCAHRYTVRDVHKQSKRVIDSKRGMLGMCYILESDLTLPKNDLVGYKNLMVVRDAVGGKRLETKDSFDDHAEWGVCQVGTSVDFVSQENEEDDDMAVFGAPGCFTWRGNIFGSYIGTQRRYGVAVNHETFTKFSKHGHLGLSVTSGRFFNNEMYLVSGAPHANKSGAIYFFKKDRKNRDHFEPQGQPLTLSDGVFGAGFGYSLATLDSNGDTFPDLLVGAPFFESGAVYLYTSKSQFLDKKNPIKILGFEVLSQFGLAISSVSDLNHDGYDDFAVGAPYETESGGSVYIFFGGPKGLKSMDSFSSLVIEAKTMADQIIKGADMQDKVQSQILAFGGSISGGMDLDGNGYPDVLIGAYQSDQIFLFRSRPIIDINTFIDERNLKGVNPGKSGCPEDPNAEEACFSFKTCFRVLDHVTTNLRDEDLILNFVIEAEPGKPMSRVAMKLLENHNGDRNGNKSSIITDTIKIIQDKEHCSTIIGYVSDLHTDLLTPVQFSMSYSIVQEEPHYSQNDGSSLPIVNNYPILNQAQAKKKFQATFDKDCASEEICQSQIEIIGSLKDKYQNELSKTTKAGFYTLELGNLNGSELILDIQMNNLGEPAYEASLDVHFPYKSISFIGLNSNQSDLNAPDIKNASWLSFNCGNPFKNTTNGLRTQLRFLPHDSINEKLIQFYINANTTSVLIVDPSTYVNLIIVKRAEVKITGGGFPRSVWYGSGGEFNKEIKGESAFNELAELGPSIIHRYLVKNSGPSTIDVLTVEIDWPFQVENGKPQGKWLLYLSDDPLLKNGKGICVLPNGIDANPLNYTSSSSSYRKSFNDDVMTGLVSESVESLHERLKREVEYVILPSNRGDKGQKLITLDCDRGTAKCIKIQCQIYDLKNGQSATIEIRSRLWNATIEEDYNRSNFLDSDDEVKIEIYSKAHLKVDDDITQNIGDDYVSVRTLAQRVQIESVEKLLSWWIILIAVIAGLLVLVIISLILWKLGFFKRKRINEEDDDSNFLMSANFNKVLYSPVQT